MSKAKTFSSLALTSLAILTLAACQQQESSSVEQSTTTATKQTASSSTAGSSEASSKAKTSASSSKTATSSSSTKAETGSATQEVTVPQETGTESQPELVQPVAPASQASPVPAVEAPVTEVTNPSPNQSLPGISTVSPGAAAGSWIAGAGHSFTIYADGRIDSGNYVSSNTSGENGILYLSIRSGSVGAYAHYYPAGTPLILNLVSYDSEGNEIIESKDYTDSSRDRLFVGTGGYGILKEDLDDYINQSIYYR